MPQDFQAIQTDTISQNPDGSYTFEGTDLELIRSLQYVEDAKHRGWIVLSRIPQSSLSLYITQLNPGDILLSINDLPIITFSNKRLKDKLEKFKKSSSLNTPYRLTFLNGKATNVEQYIEDMKNYPSYSLYGFQCSLDEKAREMERHEDEYKQRELLDKEWTKYLKSIGSYKHMKPGGVYNPSPRLRSLVRRGIPAAMRAKIWQEISLTSLYKGSKGPNFYQSLLDRISDLSEQTKHDIENDLDRTIPNHPNFRDCYSPGQTSLRRVLSAYAVHNPRIGYCQGINFIAGTLLLFLEEEDAFWLFATMMDKLLPQDMYGRHMTDANADQLVIKHIIKQQFHEIDRNLKINQLPLPTLSWFLGLYVNVVRFDVTLRIWDIFLNEGYLVLFQIAFAILEIYENDFIHANDDITWNKLLNKIQNELDADTLINRAFPPEKVADNLVTLTLPTAGSTAEVFSEVELKAQREVLATVPRCLSGIGVAHMGPILQRIDTTLYPPIVNVAQHEWIKTDAIQDEERSPYHPDRRSAHRFAGKFLNDDSIWTKMMSTVSLQTTCVEVKPQRVIPNREEIQRLRLVFREVFLIHLADNLL